MKIRMKTYDSTKNHNGQNSKVKIKIACQAIKYRKRTLICRNRNPLNKEQWNRITTKRASNLSYKGSQKKEFWRTRYSHNSNISNPKEENNTNYSWIVIRKRNNWET